MKLYDAKLEQRLLVSIMDSGDTLSHQILSEVQPSWFGFEPAKEVFEYLHNALRTGESIPTARMMVHEKALSERARTFLEKGSRDRIKHPQRITKTADVKKALRIAAKYRKQRILDIMGHRIADEMEKDSPDHETLFADLEDNLLKANRGSAEEMSHVGAGDNSDDDLEAMLSDEVLDLIPTGFPTFDKNVKGIGRGDLMILAANYGGGKTAKALQLGRQTYKKGYSVCIVELEMSKGATWQRIWSGETGIDFESFRNHTLTPEEKDKVRAAKAKWQEHGKKTGKRFTVWSTSDISANQIVSRLKPYGYDLIIIDYVNLIDPQDPKKDERVQLSAIARTLKLAAKETNLNCAMVLLAQLSDENRVKYARAISEHADFILWWRIGEEEEASGYFIVHMDKARNSRKYSTKFKKDFGKMRVHDMGETEGPAVIPKKGDDQDASGKTRRDDKKGDKTVTKRPQGMSDLMTLG